MVKRYVMVRMPIEADEAYKQKKIKMEKRIKSWTGKDIKIKMTDAHILFSKTPNEIPEGNVIRLVKKKRAKTQWY